MSKPSPARYRTTNWSSYTSSVRRRGSLLIWLDKEMTWLAPPDGSPGRPAVFSDAVIQICLTIKVLFMLPLRQTTGMEASLLKMANLDWAEPDKPTSVPDPNNKQDISIDLPLYETSPTAQVTGRSKAAVFLVIGLAVSLWSRTIFAAAESRNGIS